jgi:flavin reductase (DIM6/NTAB) family NADH-FMN oxidoreductase RutF
MTPLGSRSAIATHVGPVQSRRVPAHSPAHVSIVSPHWSIGPIVMAANPGAFASPNPRLMSFPASSSMTWPGFRETERLSINVFTGNCEDLSRHLGPEQLHLSVGAQHESRSTMPADRDASAWDKYTLEEVNEAVDDVELVRATDATLGARASAGLAAGRVWHVARPS